MSAQGIRAGKAFVELGLDNNPLVKGLKASEDYLKNLGARVAAVGATLSAAAGGALATLAASLNSFVDAGSRLDDFSQRTGILAGALSELEYAADLSGTSLEKLVDGFSDAQKKIGEAAGGNKSAAAEFAALGISVAELAALSPEDQFLRLADAVADTEGEARQAAVAAKLFGGAAKELLPLLREGADGMQELRDRAREMGLTLSTEDAAAAAAFGDKLDDLTKSIHAAWVNIGSSLVPALSDVLDVVQPLLTEVVDWARENKALVATVAAVAAAVAGAGASLVALGGALSLAGVAAGGLAALLGAVLSPVGLAVAAVGAATAALFAFSEAARKVASDVYASFAGAFGTLAGDVQATVGGIVSAMQGGDIGKAADVAFTGLEVVWQRVVNALNSQWLGWRDAFVDVAEGAVLAVANVFVGLGESIGKTISGIFEGLEVEFNLLVKDITVAIARLASKAVPLAKALGIEADVGKASRDANRTANAGNALARQRGEAERAAVGVAADAMRDAVADAIGARGNDRSEARAAAIAAQEAKLAELLERQAALIASIENPTPADLAARLPGGGGGLPRTAIPEAMTAGGSFSAFLGRTLAGPSSAAEAAAKETAKNTKETTKYLKKLADRPTGEFLWG